MSVRMDQLQQQEELRVSLQKGLRSYGSPWLARRLGSLNKPQLVALGVAVNVTVSRDMRNWDMADALLAKFKCMEPIFDLRCVATEGGPSGLREKLEGIRVGDLRNIAAQLGLPGGGVKRELVTKLFNHVSSQDGSLDCHKETKFLAIGCFPSVSAHVRVFSWWLIKEYPLYNS